MSSPKANEVLFAYIAVAPHAVSLVLIWVDNGKQRPVYYMSKSLHEAKIRYLPLEKAILAVVHGTRNLPHYFLAHTVIVLTQLPLKATLRNADYTRRIAKWGTILGASNIKFMPRTFVKGLVLAGLVARFAEFPLEKEAENQGMDEKLVGTISLQNFYSRMNILISFNLLKRLNRTLAMSSPQASCFGEINTHWHLLKRLNRTLAMSSPRSSYFGEINMH